MESNRARVALCLALLIAFVLFGSAPESRASDPVSEGITYEIRDPLGVIVPGAWVSRLRRASFPNRFGVRTYRTAVGPGR